jgi:hypothetical protein
METTEKIVEAYCRYIKNLFTISNVKIKNDELDLLAVDTYKKSKTVKYHIEVSVSISSGFSKLTSNKFDIEKYRERNNQASQRRTIGFFIKQKFNKPEHIEKLKELGFHNGNYKKVIVSWGWTDEAKIIADQNNIELWDFREIIKEIGEYFKDDKTYFKDDTLRTLQLYIRAVNFSGKVN